MAKKTTARTKTESKPDIAAPALKPRTASKTAKPAVADTDGNVATRTRKATTASAKPATASAPAPSDEAIRERAYHRWLERGAGSGRDFDDWLEAEKELRQRK